MRATALEDFALERYFARWEFEVAHQLSASDVEPYALSEVLALADVDARARWDALSLGYTEPSGLRALREAIATMYTRTDASQVLVVAGAEEGIFLTMHACLEPGDDVIVVTPAYQSLHSIARSLGANVRELRLSHDDGWELDPDALSALVTNRTRMIVINYPHNPTGAMITPTVQRRIAQIADDAGAVLFSDEVYGGLEHPGTISLPPAADLSERAVSLGVMSKSYALAGLRIGWIATRSHDLLAEVARLKDYTTICNSAPSEILALMALRARDRVLTRSRSIISDNLSHAHEFVQRFAEILEWVPPRGGSTALPRFRSQSADVLAPELAQRSSVLLVPGSVFGCAPECFRLGLGRIDFPLALGRFGEMLGDIAHL